MTTHDNGRRFEAELAALVKEENGLVVLRAPRPGFLREAPSKGRALREGERVNDHGYIVPGLGDAGDRMFGTR